MASIQAKHSRKCARPSPWSTFRDALDGCTCSAGPTYYVVVRTGQRIARTPVGRDRDLAELELRREENADLRRRKRHPPLVFCRWAENWLQTLEVKDTTLSSNGRSLKRASDYIGDTPLERITPEVVVGLNVALRNRNISTSTRVKDLRALGACLQGAYRHGHAPYNAVRLLSQSEKPRGERKEAAYFENDALVPLFREFCDELYRLLCLLSLKTGLRAGELAALQWSDVDLDEGVIRVRRSYTGGRVGSPKNRQRRDVDLTSEVIRVVDRWRQRVDSKPGALVFLTSARRGCVEPNILLRRHLYPAMERARVPRVGLTGETRSFHSFRHTFAKIAIETGTDLTWLSRQLGHGSVYFTEATYGHWERRERRRQAAKMEGAFPVGCRRRLVLSETELLQGCEGSVGTEAPLPDGQRRT